MRSGDPLDWPDDGQSKQLRAYAAELRSWNAKVNLIARATEGDILERHVRHCLAIGALDFPVGSTIVDWGTGGGLPAIPLAILFPGAQVVAVDSIGKKTAALKMMVRSLALPNVTVWQGRAEDYTGKGTHFVTRATAPLRKLWRWSVRVLEPMPPVDGCWESGLICLKGGDLGQEIRQLRGKARVTQMRLSDVAPGMPFQDKYILHVQKAGSDGESAHHSPRTT